MVLVLTVAWWSASVTGLRIEAGKEWVVGTAGIESCEQIREWILLVEVAKIGHDCLE